MKSWYVVQLLALALLASCASAPPAAFLEPGRSAALVNLALDRSVVPLGESDDSGPGMLADRSTWEVPLALGSERWADAIQKGWTAVDPALVDWTLSSSQTEDYARITKLPDDISSIGFLRPDAVRYFTPKGWNYIAVSETAKWADLAKSLGVTVLWSVVAQANFVVDDTRESEGTMYHIVVRNVVRLYSEGKELGRYDVMSYSASHRLFSWTTARRELPTTLEEAGKDFVLRWARLTQNVK